jgi:hypothetical protein
VYKTALVHIRCLAGQAKKAPEHYSGALIIYLTAPLIENRFTIFGMRFNHC